MKSASLERERRAEELFSDEMYEEAFVTYKPLADAGSAVAQVRVGWMYENGKGVARSLEAAESWYRRAADADLAQAQFCLANLHRWHGRPEDAIPWLRKAAAQAYPPAWFVLGVMYERGEGTVADSRQAWACYEKAARMGHLFARRRFAVETLSGRDGLWRIPFGVVELFRILWEAVRIGSRGHERTMY